MPIPRSPLDGRYLTNAEKWIVAERAKVSFAQIRSWQARWAIRGDKMRDAHARIDAIMDSIIAARADVKMQTDGDVADTLEMLAEVPKPKQENGFDRPEFWDDGDEEP